LDDQSGAAVTGLAASTTHKANSKGDNRGNFVLTRVVVDERGCIDGVIWSFCCRFVACGCFFFLSFVGCLKCLVFFFFPVVDITNAMLQA
jgi:hypothetical protein